MHTKTLLTITLIVALPLTVMADFTYNENYNIPHVDGNGTVYIAGDGGPYQTMNISNEDKNHIASTAYVKGAYNDAVAMINYLGDNTHYALRIVNTYDPIYPEVFNEYVFTDALASGEDMSDADDRLITTAAVAAGIRSQRATVYTTWDNDNATRQVALTTVSQ